MKLEVGMYVRTKEGIEKIICIEEKFMDDNVTFYATDNDIWRSAYNGRYNGFTSRSDVIIKSSSNIIDLIEVGDYVNGMKVIQMYSPEGAYTLWIKLSDNTFIDNSEDIKSIVTKEQFEAMQYKVV